MTPERTTEQENLSQWIKLKRRWRVHELNHEQFVSFACLLGREDAAKYMVHFVMNVNKDRKVALDVEG